MQTHPVVSREEWLKARKALLKQEKAVTRMNDLVAAERRRLPWVKIEKDYVFDTPEGKKKLADLFGGNSQLFVYHFMWRWDLGQGCVSCSFFGDLSKTIYLPEGWTAASPAHVSVLVYELVHHQQNAGGMKFDCPQEREAPAYRAQARWLELFGKTLADEFEIDAMTVLVRSRCMH